MNINNVASGYLKFDNVVSYIMNNWMMRISMIDNSSSSSLSIKRDMQ